jgi:hypothetical protein
VGSAYPPNTYHLGISWWRSNPTDATWPIEGLVQVERFVDGTGSAEAVWLSQLADESLLYKDGQIYGFNMVCVESASNRYYKGDAG